MILVPSFRATLAILISSGLLAAPAVAARTHRHASTASSTHRSHRSTGHRSHRLHGQQSIDTERATQIQQALIREHYMTGEATGQWDASTVAAMQKFQADQGWQTKLMPDSRALKKLGLGPDYSNALNARSSTFADPPPGAASPTAQNAGFAAAAGVSQ
jgi:peptidoglycan hydrolase-like protein with peptidoglycan-binding domain